MHRPSSAAATSRLLDRGDLAGDERAGRVADQVCLAGLDVVEQAHDVGVHLGAVGVRVVRLVALAVSPTIRGDQLEAGRVCRDVLESPIQPWMRTTGSPVSFVT